MSRIEAWILRRVFAAEVRQGFAHDKRIAGLYQMIREACEQEFYEDNAATLNNFLQECFDGTQKWSHFKSEQSNG